jgi:hypothetical protein
MIGSRTFPDISPDKYFFEEKIHERFTEVENFHLNVH